MSSSRVAVLGYGAIGQEVADILARGDIRRAELAGVVTRGGSTGVVHQLSVRDAIERSDVIVECAGPEALVTHAPSIVAAGRTLVVTSVGALGDLTVRRRLDAGPGRWVTTAGAVGGLDILAAASRYAPFDFVQLTTTKHPEALRQPWMDESEVATLLRLREPTTLFVGAAREAGRSFPTSLNVALSVSLAARTDDVLVTVRADPGAERTTHEIRARHPLGDYDLRVNNRPSPWRPGTSAVVSYAVARTLQLVLDPRGDTL